jgi:hypothetical protein
MGSEYQSFTVRNNPSAKEIRHEFDGYRDDRYSVEEGYSGTLYEKGHIRILDNKVFKNEDEAEEYLSDENGKWDDAWAVPFHDMCDLPKATKVRAKKALDKAKQEVIDFEADIVKRIRNAKSKTISCSCCKTRFQRTSIHSISCNNCNRVTGIASATDQKRLNTKRQNVRKAEKKYSEVRNDTKKGKGISYVCGGNCSC